jgi:phage terminase large subunit-like protein
VPFSKPHSDAALNFFELVLKHSADEWYGKPFDLMPWQERAIEAIFGTVCDSGNRIIEMAYLEVPKKAGKTEFAAGIALLVLILSTQNGCQVYGAAAATRQAMNVYRAACAMVEQSPLLRSQLRIMRGTNRIVKKSDPDSFYAAIAADGDFGDGVNPACVIADEVHRWKTRKQLENWDVLSNGGITRSQTLTIAITTAGVQSESPLAWRLHEKTRRIEEGIVEDPKFYGRIYGATRDDDPSDPATWIKANPSLKENGGFLDIEKIRAKYEALSAEGDLTSFKRYYLNIWDQKETRAIDLAQWDACPPRFESRGLLPRLPEDPCRSLPHDLLAHFIERPCWAGVDLSMTTDLSAVSLVFPCHEEGEAEAYEVLPFFWTPDETIRKRELRDGVPYQQWAEAGFLELSPGNVIDYRDIQSRLEWAARLFDLQEICFDPWNSRQLSVSMLDAGYRCVEVRQGMQTLSAPSKLFLELIASGRLHHGGHPVLRWNASCCATTERNDNLMFAKPERSKNSSRIDGISATVNALYRAAVAPRSIPQLELW